MRFLYRFTIKDICFTYKLFKSFLSLDVIDDLISSNILLFETVVSLLL